MDRWVRAAGLLFTGVFARVPARGAVFVCTLAINLPINGDQAGWSVQSPPGDWASVRDRWQVAHLVRTVAAVSAFGAFVAAALTSGDRVQAARGAGRVSVGV
jgi:uncharacterized membrane protein